MTGAEGAGAGGLLRISTVVAVVGHRGHVS